MGLLSSKGSLGPITHCYPACRHIVPHGNHLLMAFSFLRLLATENSGSFELVCFLLFQDYSGLLYLSCIVSFNLVCLDYLILSLVSQPREMSS